jgi:hypothetical protein
MKKSVTFLLAAALIASTAISFAQGGGGQGRGQGGRGMMGQRNQGFGLLNRKDVQADLKMTADQIKAAEAARAAQQEEMRNAFQNGGGGGDPEAMRKMMEDMQKKNDAAIAKILDEKQVLRLSQIGWQLQGNRAIQDPKLQKAIGLTESQIADIKKLQAKQQEANASIMEKMRNGEIERDQLQELRAKNDKVLEEEIGKILTQKNKDDMKAQLGEPFKADPNENQGGRRPPPAN